MALAEITTTTYLIVLPLIFLAGLIDSMAGGGGLISLPAYLVAGLSPHNALATNKMSSTFGTFTCTVRYFRHNMIDVKVAATGAVFALVGSYFGTRTVLAIDPFFLNYILIVLLPIITIWTLLNKNIGLHNTSHQLDTSQKLLYGSLAGGLIGFYDGFFGPGTGSFLILIFAVLMKYDFVMANGNTKVINLASNIAALTGFIIGGKVVFAIGIPAAFAGIAGNLVGSKLVVIKGNRIIRPIFIVAFVILFIKILRDFIVSF